MIIIVVKLGPGERERKDIGKYCFVNRTIKVWNQLPAEALVTLRCKLHILKRG